MNSLDGLTRREAIRLIGVGGAYTALNSYDAIAQYRESGPPSCRTTLQQVKNGTVDPRVYLSERERCIPQAVTARGTGKLSGFLYNPTDGELRELLNKLFGLRVKNSADLRVLVQTSIDYYNNAKNNINYLATVVPGTINVFGEGTPLYLAFLPRLFAGGISNDAEMESLVHHELSHIEDFSGGIRLGNIYLSHSAIMMPPRTATIKFLENLMELRGYYRELEYIFSARAKTRVSPVSLPWAGSRVAKYADYWSSLQETTTVLEREASKIQLENFKGITPETDGDKIIVRSTLFGTKDGIAATRKRQRN